ncbi:unnamed protein product [Schistosoma turkestanicum]|nr:unnamed protein product [Schistosoma turkestanicum]
MSLLFVILYLSIFNKRLVENVTVQQSSINDKSNKNSAQRKGEFIVGEKFRVQVVLSEDLENLLLFDEFKKQVKDAVTFWTRTLQPKIRSTKQILIERPIAGTILICSAMQYLESNPNHLKRIIMHELGHTFGFDYSVFSYLRDENGQPRTTRNPQTGEPELPKDNEGLEADKNTVKYVQRDWKTISGVKSLQRISLTLPSVVSFARRHFGCNDLDGVDLESDGGGGTPHSHFERRLSIGEIMSGYIDIMASVSGLTLGYFNDTGWYNVNFSMAERWEWGRDQGCDFIHQSCGEFIKTQKSRGQKSSPWCDELALAVRCIPHVNAYGACNLMKFSSSLKPEHTHFNNVPDVSQSEQNMLAGVDDLADHCPYMAVFTSLKNTSLNSHCEDTDNQKYQHMDSIPEYYGKQSRCFNIRIVHRNSIGSHVSAGCYKVKCNLRSQVEVMFNDKWRKCPENGGDISIYEVPNRIYRLECPVSKDICPEEETRERIKKRANRLKGDSNYMKTNTIS